MGRAERVRHHHRRQHHTGEEEHCAGSEEPGNGEEVGTRPGRRFSRGGGEELLGAVPAPSEHGQVGGQQGHGRQQQEGERREERRLGLVDHLAVV